MVTPDLDLALTLEHLRGPQTYVGNQVIRKLDPQTEIPPCREKSFSILQIEEGFAHLNDQLIQKGEILIYRHHESSSLKFSHNVSGYYWSTFITDGQWSFPTKEQDFFCIYPLDSVSMACLALIYREVSQNDAWRIQRLSAFLQIIFTGIQRSLAQPQRTEGGLSAEQCDAITQYANQRVSERFGSDDLAHHLGLSREYFARQLKKTFGISAREWIVYSRMRMAASRLQSTQMSILAIAEELGYEESTLFCRQFKKFYKKSPLQFRKKPSHGQLDLWSFKT